MCAAESYMQEQILLLQNSGFHLKPVITNSSGSVPSKHMSSKYLTMPHPNFKILCLVSPLRGGYNVLACLQVLCKMFRTHSS